MIDRLIGILSIPVFCFAWFYSLAWWINWCISRPAPLGLALWMTGLFCVLVPIAVFGVSCIGYLLAAHEPRGTDEKP